MDPTMWSRSSHKQVLRVGFEQLLGEAWRSMWIQDLKPQSVQHEEPQLQTWNTKPDSYNLNVAASVDANKSEEYLWAFSGFL